MPEKAEHWADQICLSLWIFGHRSPLFSVREVWRLTLSMTVILMTLAIGSIVAFTMIMSHLVAGDQNYYLQLPFILIPLLCTLASSCLISAAFYIIYHRRLKAGVVPDVITVPVTFTAIIPCMLLIFLFNGLKYVAGVMSLDWFLLVTAATPIIYVLISDYIHFLILRYVAPSILGRPPIEPPHTAVAKDGRTGFAGSLISLLPAALRGRKAERQQRASVCWRSTVCLSIWISGHRSSLMSVRELWAIVFSRIVLALSVLVGSVAGVAATVTLMAVEDGPASAPSGFSFYAEATAQFDNLSGGFWQRIFDFGNGPGQQNILLTQVGNSDSIRFEVYNATGLGSVSVEVPNQIIPGEVATWRAQVSDAGQMQLFKNDVLIGERAGVVVPDVPRSNLLVASSNWSGDTPLIGAVTAIIADVNGDGVADVTEGIMPTLKPTHMVLMLFSIAPVFVNIGSAALMSMYVFFRLSRAKDADIPVIVVPSLLTIYVMAVPAIALIYTLKVAAGGLGENWVIYVMTITPVVYALISDFFHFVVFFFIAPSIWGRAHIYEPVQMAQATPEGQAHNDDAAPAEPVFAKPTGHEIRIGNTIVAEGDLVFLEAQGNYLRVVTKSEEHLERFRISAAVEQLSDELGMYVHRSYWVAYSGIDGVSFLRGQYKIQTTHGEAINVASTRQQDVEHALKDRGLISADKTDTAVREVNGAREG